MAGINERELNTMLTYYKVDTDKKMLKDWYNHYIFSEEISQGIYNTDMILYFISHHQQNNKPPVEMIDINVRSDYSKLRNIIYTNKKLNGNFETLQTLIAGDSVSVPSLIQDFSALNLEKTNNFKSLMFYLGLVAINKRELDLNLKIPNETDIDFLQETLALEKVFTLNTDKIEEYLKAFALEGKTELFAYLADSIKESSGLRDYIYKEQHIKAMYIAYLSLTPYYIIKSEKELNKGFVDILIKPFNPYVKYIGLLEFKYVKREEKLTKKRQEKLKSEAEEQLNRYEKDILVQEYVQKGLILKKVVLIFHGWELIKYYDIRTK